MLDPVLIREIPYRPSCQYDEQLFHRFGTINVQSMAINARITCTWVIKHEQAAQIIKALANFE